MREREREKCFGMVKEYIKNKYIVNMMNIKMIELFILTRV